MNWVLMIYAFKLKNIENNPKAVPTLYMYILAFIG